MKKIMMFLGFTASVAAAAEPESRTETPPQAVPPAAQVCVTCHGADGQGMESLGARLAGLSAEYITAQIAHFKSGDRQNPLMSPIASQLQAADSAQAAEFFASRPVAPIHIQYRGDKVVITDPAEKLAYQGDWSRIIPPCTSCHGPSAIGGGAFPRLAGQQASYLRTQLIDWRRGARKGDPDNVMGSIANRLTEAEIDSLSRYFAGLK